MGQILRTLMKIDTFQREEEVGARTLDEEARNAGRSNQGRG